MPRVVLQVHLLLHLPIVYLHRSKLLRRLSGVHSLTRLPAWREGREGGEGEREEGGREKRAMRERRGGRRREKEVKEEEWNKGGMERDRVRERDGVREAGERGKECRREGGTSQIFPLTLCP